LQPGTSVVQFGIGVEARSAHAINAAVRQETMTGALNYLFPGPLALRWWSHIDPSSYLTDIQRQINDLLKIR
jgi:hypothetical protein